MNDDGLFGLREHFPISKEEGWGSGRRKKSRAVARVKAGKGVIRINKKPATEYFQIGRAHV